LQTAILKNWASTLAERETLSAICFASAIVCILTEPIFLSPLFFYYPILIYFGLKFLGKVDLSWSKEVALCAVIAVSAVVAVPYAPFFEGHNWAATLFHAALTLILVPLLFVTNVKQIFYALIPFCYLQAGLMTWQWFIEGMGRPTGLAFLNANAGSSFLLLGALFLVTQPKYKWLSVPLFMAIPFSGSRWVAVVGVVILGLIFLSKHVPWRYVLVGIGSILIVLFGVQHTELLAAYRVTDSATTTTEAIKEHIEWRLTAKDDLFSPAIFIPKGFINSQLHNVPIRMATETGLLSGLAWLAVGGLVLIRRPPFDYAWWMMLAVCLLSMMYYFTWLGPLGAFWWLLVSDLRGRRKLVEYGHDDYIHKT